MPTRSQREPAPKDAPIDDVAWLETTLFTSPAGRFTKSARGGNSEVDTQWAMLPVRGAPRRLVPTSGKFAAEAFANHHDGMSIARRTLGRVVRTSVRSGALGLVPLLRANTEMVFADPDRSVIAAAAAGLDQPILSCAITLGPRRYNRKPVVQLMGNDAQTIGFLKVAADSATSTMVATEAAAIAQVQQPTSPLLQVPRVLWQSEWNGRSVACFSSLAISGRSLMPADRSRLADVAKAVIDAGGGQHNVDLRGSAPVERLRAEANLGSRTVTHQLLDRIEAVFGSHTVSIGRWHGDFSPWNMISTERSTALIDWEFSSPEMPVGSDLLHYRIMVATHLDGDPVQHPLQQLDKCGRDIPELHALSVPVSQHQPHLLLYLLELIRRDFELDRIGLPVTGFGAPAHATAVTILDQIQTR